MAGVYRFFFVAVCGLVIVCSSDAYAQSTSSSSDPQQAIAESLGKIATTYDQQAKRAQGPDKQAEPCQRGDDRRYSDLCAQWKAADSAADSAWWAWAGGVIGLGSLVGVFCALGLAYHSNWIARDTARRQLRAYIGFCGWRHETEDGILTFFVTIKNFGQTPAKNLRIQCLVTPEREFSHKALPFESSAVVDLPPGNDWKDHSASYGGVTDGMELHYFAEIRYSDIFGRRWALPVRYYRNINGNWFTVPDENGSNQEYEIIDHRPSPFKRAASWMRRWLPS